MNLIVFTAHYPYGNGEPFLEDEMRIAERYFDSITIVTYAKNNEKLSRYIPHNANVIELRRDYSNFISLMKCIKALFYPRVWKEFVYGCRERGLRKAVLVFNGILVAERHCSYIENVKSKLFNDCDNNIYYSYWINPAALYLSRVVKEKDIFCISRTHGGDCFYDRGYVPWRKDILNKLNVIYSISESGRNDILNHYSDSISGLENKVKVARLGVNINLSNSNVTHNKANSSEFTIVTCSNIIKLKRLDILIEALTELSDLKIKWIHFGDGSLMNEIVHLANSKLGSSLNTSFEFKGRVSKPEIYDFYANNRVDLFVNCSDVEGIPVSAMEAMMFRIPVVARNVGGLSELVSNKCGMLLSENCTSSDFANGIRTILSVIDRYSYERLREDAFITVNSKFNAENNYCSFFEGLMRGKHEHNK